MSDEELDDLDLDDGNTTDGSEGAAEDDVALSASERELIKETRKRGLTLGEVYADAAALRRGARQAAPPPAAKETADGDDEQFVSRREQLQARARDRMEAAQEAVEEGAGPAIDGSEFSDLTDSQRRVLLGEVAKKVRLDPAYGEDEQGVPRAAVVKRLSAKYIKEVLEAERKATRRRAGLSGADTAAKRAKNQASHGARDVDDDETPVGRGGDDDDPMAIDLTGDKIPADTAYNTFLSRCRAQNRYPSPDEINREKAANEAKFAKELAKSGAGGR